MMGDGAVVTPTEGTVYAPADGEVEFIFDTKHAIGFRQIPVSLCFFIWESTL